MGTNISQCVILCKQQTHFFYGNIWINLKKNHFNMNNIKGYPWQKCANLIKMKNKIEFTTLEWKNKI